MDGWLAQAERAAGGGAPAADGCPLAPSEAELLRIAVATKEMVRECIASAPSGGERKVTHCARRAVERCAAHARARFRAIAKRKSNATSRSSVPVCLSCHSQTRPNNRRQSAKSCISLSHPSTQAINGLPLHPTSRDQTKGAFASRTAAQLAVGRHGAQGARGSNKISLVTSLTPHSSLQGGDPKRTALVVASAAAVTCAGAGTAHAVVGSEPVVAGPVTAGPVGTVRRSSLSATPCFAPCRLRRGRGKRGGGEVARGLPGDGGSGGGGDLPPPGGWGGGGGGGDWGESGGEEGAGGVLRTRDAICALVLAASAHHSLQVACSPDAPLC